VKQQDTQPPLELRLAMARLNALGFWLDHLTRGKWDEASLLHGDWAGLLCPDGCVVPWPRCAEMRDEKIGNIVCDVIDEHDTDLPSEDIGRLVREALEREGFMVVPEKAAVRP